MSNVVVSYQLRGKGTATEPAVLQFDVDGLSPTLEELIRKFPATVRVREIPLGNFEIQGVAVNMAPNDLLQAFMGVMRQSKWDFYERK